MDTSTPPFLAVRFPGETEVAAGGKNHFAVDREVAEKAFAAMPTGRTAARENRAFLGRVVRYLAAEEGIRQFLDIGTGLPTTTTCTRWPSGSRRGPGSSTSTTTRWCSLTRGHCSLRRRRGAPQVRHD
jgi:hypothetical protein